MPLPRRPAGRADPRRVSVRLVRGGQDLESVRGLFWEYYHWLADHREVTAFDDSMLRTGLAQMAEEIRGLPGEYCSPRGDLVIAREGKTPIGCGALRPLGPGEGELKRIFLRAEYRGRGLGRRLTEALITRARRIGYERLLLDSLPTMTSAIALYRGLGFRPVPPYWAHPFPGALFFGLDLPKGPGKGLGRPGRARLRSPRPPPSQKRPR